MFFLHWLGPEKSPGELAAFRRVIVAIILAALIVVPNASGQRSDGPIRVETELTAVEVTVTDKNGKPVRGLKPGDFRLFEDGKPVDIAFFEPIRRGDSGRPLVIVVAVDVSGSMTVDEMAIVRIALNRFVTRLNGPDTYFALMTFGMEVNLIRDFTNNAGVLERSSKKISNRDEGLSTHAYDAADAAVRQFVRKSPKTVRGRFPRRAVILVTDGFPVGDTVSPNTVIERANDAETSIFSIIVPSYSRLQGKKKPLPTLLESSGLIEKTGGRSFYASDSEYERLFESLTTELTSSYVLAFYPTASADSSSEHIIRVEADGYKVKQNRTAYRKASKRLQ
jgi:VWFA-related protein